MHLKELSYRKTMELEIRKIVSENNETFQATTAS